MSNLANGRAIVKLKNSVLNKKNSSSLYSNFILSSYIAYELCNWSLNPPIILTKKLIIWYSKNSYEHNQFDEEGF